MGGAVSSSIGNKYGKRIWVKYDVEKKYVTMKNYEVTGQVGVSEISAGAGVSVSETYDWNKIQMDFTPIKPDDFKELTIESKNSKVVYITIVAEDREILCQTWPMNVGRSIVITEGGELRKSGHSHPLQVHKKYDNFALASSEKAMKWDSAMKSSDNCCSKLPFFFSTTTAKISPTSDVTKR